MAHWMKFPHLFAAAEAVVEALTGEKRFDKVFDRVVASCAVAGPEEVIEPVSGHLTSWGHVVIFVDWRADHDGEPTDLDGWILSILQNDGYTIQKIGDYAQSYNFSHEEPEWPEALKILLHNSYWRVLDTALLFPTK